VSGQVSRRDRLVWTARMVWDASRQGRFPYRSPGAIREVQERRIRAIVAHAGTHVPFYREAFRRLGLDPAEIRTAADLGRLPLVARSDVQRDPESFRSRAWPLEACATLESGGSSGQPLTVFRDPASFPAEAAQRERLRSLVTRLAGRRFRHREADIVPIDSSAADAVRQVRRQTLVPGGLRIERRIYSIWRSPAELIPELDRYRPDVIGSYGSYLEALFAHLREGQATMRLPPVVVYGADAMTDGMRAYILHELGIELLSSYNAIETPGVGWECEAHRGYHLNVDLCPVRLVRPDGAPAAAGESGEVVISNLVNHGSVLLNYRLGDLASPLSGPCPCGRTLPMLSFLEARATAWLHLGGGRTIHPHAARLPFRKERDLWRYQVVQEERRRFLVRTVLNPDCDRDLMAPRLAALLRKSLGQDVDVRVECVDDLPRGASGKVQTVVPLPPEGA